MAKKRAPVPSVATCASKAVVAKPTTNEFIASHTEKVTAIRTKLRPHRWRSSSLSKDLADPPAQQQRPLEGILPCKRSFWRCCTRGQCQAQWLLCSCK